MADADRIAAALRYQQDQAMPSPLAAAIQSPEYIGGALRDPQFYGDIGRRLSGLLKGGLQDILPTGAGPIMAKQGYEADPNYMQKMNDVGLAGMTVFHGSPYKFDKFDMGKIGTGEGAQAYGHGLYLAENPVVAKEYQKTLSAGRAPNVVDSKLQQLYDQTGNWETAVDKHLGSVYNTPKVKAQMRETMLKNGPPLNTEGGSFYKVDLPDEHIAKMLDWDKPLSQQHPDVQKALDVALDTHFTEEGAKHVRNMGWPSSLFEGWATENPALTSEALRKSGVPGIRYLDAGSRTGGAGTSNFVVFDPAHMNIIGRE